MKLKSTLIPYLRLLVALGVIMLATSANAWSQQAERIIKGTVYNEDREPMIGATVSVEGTSVGTTTDTKGDFELKMRNSAKVLLINFIGYKSSRVDLNATATYNVYLEPETQGIDDVVVIGYGVVRKTDLTGSVSVLSTKDKLETMPVTSADQFIQGRMAGVNISQNSGAPGDGMSIQVRGISTLSGGTAPLYVIDGFPVEASTARSSGSINELSSQPAMNPLASINPNDIQSIQVLKDASATAIYGSRATNGVVIITTKQGADGNVKINFNSRVDISQVSKKYDLLNAYEYGLFTNELDRTSKGYDMYGEIIPTGKTPRHDEAKLDLFKKYSTDWQSLMFETSVSHDQQLTISGGNKVSNFNVTGGYTKQNGIILNTGLERYSFRLNYNHNLTKRLKMTTNISYSRSEQNQTSHSQPSSLNQMIKRILTTKPTLAPESIEVEDDVIEGVAADNPYKMAYELKDILSQQFLVANASFIYNIAKGLNLKLAGNINNISGARKTYYPSNTNAGKVSNGLAFRGENKRTNVVFESTVSYNRTFNKIHRIDAVAGWTYESRITDDLQMQTGDFADDDLLFNSIGQGLSTTARDSFFQKRLMSSFLARANYSFSDRYILTLTGRYDGSSLLAVGNQWKFFPSAAIAWRIDQESFMKQVKAINNLKLRFSYGLTGNQNVGYTAAIATMNHVRVPMAGTGVHGMVPRSIADPDLGWENTTSMNAGLDLGLINNRYRLNVDIYKRITKDLLLDFGLPTSSGYNSIPMNLGQISNKGIEVEFAADVIAKGDFRLSLNANWYINRNNVDDIKGNRLGGQSYMSGGGTFGQSVHTTIAGYPVGSFYGYVTDGIYQTYQEAIKAPIDSPQATPGSIRFLDISGPDGLPDGRITADDMTILGNAEADYNYGFGADVSWKGIKLSFLFTGSHGAKVANMNRYLLDGYTDTNSNISRKAWEGRWTGPGTSNVYPAVNGASSSVFFQQRFSNILLEDASFIRLKNVTVNYSIPVSRISWLKSAGVFFTATNLFTITDYSGYDPEVSISRGALSPSVDYAAYPSCRTYSFGINLGF